MGIRGVVLAVRVEVDGGASVEGAGRTQARTKGSAEAPISGEGVLIELVQAPPEVIEAFKRFRAQGA